MHNQLERLKECRGAQECTVGNVKKTVNYAKPKSNNSSSKYNLNFKKLYYIISGSARKERMRQTIGTKVSPMS